MQTTVPSPHCPHGAPTSAAASASATAHADATAQPAQCSANPLLQCSGLPVFDQIQPAHVQPAMAQLLDEAESALQRVTQDDFPATWDALAQTLGVAIERLGRAWGAIGHLQSVADTPALRDAYNAVLPAVSAFYTRLGASDALYAKYKAMDVRELTAEQARAHHNTLIGFVLGGAELQGDARARYSAIEERLAEAQQKFSENTLDATDCWAYYATDDEVAGIPADVLHTARSAAQADGHTGYKLTLKAPCYLPVMQFAHSSALRQRLYRAYTTRASDQAAPEALQYDNSALMAEILALRHEEAQLLGYPHFAATSLVMKMADSAEQVTTFLRNLASKARPFAQQDVADARAFARDTLHLPEPQPWDWAYISEKLKEARYAFSDQEVRQYFALPRVMQGLFDIVQTLFQVRILPDTAPTWHPSVQFFRIERNGALVGQFYVDPSARTGKRGGAWMDDVRARWLRPDTGTLQTPVAHLVCNFAEGADGKPALLTHDDITTLFHEMGHGLHHLLTQVQERDVSGISGVEWDAVELPSQFMENFCWHWDVLRTMSAHVDTGAPLPRALFDKMLAAKNFQSGLHTLRQVEFALFDILLHSQHSAPSSVMPLLHQVRAEVAVLPAPDYNRMAHTFGHIFSGGYAAGYYSYKWAEVLSADAWSAFEETALPDGSFHPDTSARYLHEILERGGSRSAMQSFIAFRGREPRIDALLRHNGMLENTANHAA